MIQHAEENDNLYVAVSKLKEQLKKENREYSDLMFKNIQLRISFDSNVNDIETIFLLKKQMMNISFY